MIILLYKNVSTIIIGKKNETILNSKIVLNKYVQINVYNLL